MVAVFCAELAAAMRTGNFDITNFSFKLNKAVRPLCRGLSKTHLFCAQMFRKTCEHKGIVQEFQLRPVEPISPCSARAEGIYCNFEKFRFLPTY